MPIPDYQTLMLPLLKIAGDGKVHTKREALSVLAEQFKLTEDDRKELLPSGNQAIFDNRVGWARTYLKKAVPAWAIPDYRARQVRSSEEPATYRRSLPPPILGVSGIS